MQAVILAAGESSRFWPLNSKHKSQIKLLGRSLGIIMGENSFFGASATVMPGIFIDSNCIIGPGSIIKENIKSNIVCYTEFKNIVKKNKKKQ